jgi:hypothetical protein
MCRDCEDGRRLWDMAEEVEEFGCFARVGYEE